MFQQLFERLFLLMYFSLPVYGTIKYTTNIYVFKVWNSCIQLINLYALLYVNILGRTLCKVSFAPTSLDMSFLLYFLIPLCLNTVQDRRFSKGYRGNTTQKTQANKLINISNNVTWCLQKHNYVKTVKIHLHGTKTGGREIRTCQLGVAKNNPCQSFLVD